MSDVEETKNETISSDSMKDEPVPEESPSSHLKGPVRIFFPCAVISLIVSLTVAAGTVYLYDQHFAQKVVAVDLKGFLQEQKDDYLDGKITEEDVNRRMDELEAFVDQIPKHHSVILGDVVVRNIEVLNP
jgi:hypothetical protein